MQHHNYISSFLKGVQIFYLPLSVKEGRIPAAPEMCLQQLDFIPLIGVTLHQVTMTRQTSKCQKCINPVFLHRREYIFKAHI